MNPQTDSSTPTTNGPPRDEHDFDAEVAIVGAGPIGIELAVALKRAGVDTLHFDARQIGYSMTWWPRETEFFSTSERLAIAGVPIQTTRQGRITGEEYLAYLRGVVEQYDLRVHTYEPVEEVRPDGAGFAVRTRPLTGERCYRVRHVVVATGDMARPRRLGIPGEDLPHVSHLFTDPHHYFRTRLLVVGGKNSAVETALRCWRAGADVTVSYRRAEFDQRRVKGHLLPDLEAQIEAGAIGFLPETVPVEIRPGVAVLAPAEDGEASDGPRVEHPTDFVLLQTGYEADMRLFERAGVTLSGARQVPAFDADTMETDVPGLYVAGTAAAGTQSRYTVFIETSHVHVGRIVHHLTGQWPDRLGTVKARDHELPFSRIEAN